MVSLDEQLGQEDVIIDLSDQILSDIGDNVGKIDYTHLVGSVPYAQRAQTERFEARLHYLVGGREVNFCRPCL